MKNEQLILESNAASATPSQGTSLLFLHLIKTRYQRGPLSAPTSVAKSNRLASFRSRLNTARVRRLAHAPDSSHLVNFPFAFAASSLLLTGLLAMCWGMAIPDVSLAVGGFLFTLIGTGLYGWSLSDE